MRLNTFNIEITEYNFDNRNDKVKLIRKIINYKKMMKELYNDDKELYNKVQEKYKKSKQELNSFEDTCYCLKVSHKVLKDKIIEKDYVNIKDLKESVRDSIKTLITDIQNYRSKIRLKKKVHKDTSNGYSYSLIGHVHTVEKNFLNAYNLNKINDFKKNKKPLTVDNHIGLEIEMYIVDDNNSFEFELLNQDNKLKDKVCVSTDGSLRPKDNERSIEIKIIDVESEIYNTINKVLTVVNKFNPRVDDNCGLHVHLDMRNRACDLAFHNLVKFQKILFNMQKTARRNNQYCVEMPTEKLFQAIRNHYSHHMAISCSSLEKHETIEVRIHEGTYDNTLINNWIKLLVSIANIEKKVQTNYRSINSAGTEHNFPQEIIDYAQKRIEQYA